MSSALETHGFIIKSMRLSTDSETVIARKTGRKTTDRQTYSHADGQTQRERQRQRETANRQTDRHGHREIERRETERHRGGGGEGCR